MSMNDIEKAIKDARAAQVVRIYGTFQNAKEVTVDENTQAGKLFLNSLPLTLSFENFGSNERVAYLPKRLDMDSYDSHLSVKRGDMTYYVPWGNLAVFRKAYSSPSDLAPIGSMPENAISALEQSGDSEVSFKIK